MVIARGETALPLIVKVAEFDVSWPGFTTVMLAVPGVASSAAGTAAVKMVLLLNVVLRMTPFHVIWEPSPGSGPNAGCEAGGTKPFPLTVSTSPGVPAAAEVGSRALIAGRAVG